MTGHISFCFLLFLTGCYDCILPRTISSFSVGHEDNPYCRICANHTMCQFPQDTDGTRCVNLQHTDLNEKDIETILDWHNVYRNTVANGDEERGNPGPQRPAKFMMELIWDDELAHIARRWVVQCNLLEKDQCRDVGKIPANKPVELPPDEKIRKIEIRGACGSCSWLSFINSMTRKPFIKTVSGMRPKTGERFGVWQNVHVLDMYSVGNTTSTARIRFHIQSWYDEVEDFDSAEFGLVNFAARSNLSYIPFASSTIRQIGCGRAIYTGRSGQSTSSSTDTPIAGRTMAVGFGDRVEALVCNYGPLDRNTARELYEDGVPALCPPGTIRSSQYRALCQKFQKRQSQKVQHKIQQKQGKRNDRLMSNGAFLIKSAIYLIQLLLLLLSTRSPTYRHSLL